MKYPSFIVEEFRLLVRQLTIIISARRQKRKRTIAKRILLNPQNPSGMGRLASLFAGVFQHAAVGLQIKFKIS